MEIDDTGMVNPILDAIAPAPPGSTWGLPASRTRSVGGGRHCQFGGGHQHRRRQAHSLPQRLKGPAERQDDVGGGDPRQARKSSAARASRAFIVTRGTTTVRQAYGCCRTSAAWRPIRSRWLGRRTRSQPHLRLRGRRTGEETLTLPPHKSFYRGGLMSFPPAGSLCVAVRDSDKPAGEVWLLMYDVDKDRIRSLFRWTEEPIADFVVGPRMVWDRHSPPPSTPASTY